MNDIVRREMRLPFPGFYGSLLESEMDSVDERESEHEAETRGIDLAVVTSARYWAVDHSNAYLEVARDYAVQFNDTLKDEHEIDLELEYVTMSSPKYYNFETDRVFVTLPMPVIERMHAETNDVDLRTVIRERHSSRSGFISFYPNDLDEWTKPLVEWDHNELETLLLAFLRSKEVELDSLEDQVRETLSESNVFDNAISEATDWRKLEEKIAEGMAEDLEQPVAA